MVVGTLGTTECGKIDPLEDISVVCQKHNVWFHIDAAYGGIYILSETLQYLRSGIYHHTFIRRLTLTTLKYFCIKTMESKGLFSI